MVTYYANIQVCSFRCYVAYYDEYMYHLQNVTGLQYCFPGLIYNDQCRDYKNRYKVGNLFPISLFYNKKEGDTVKLSYSYNHFDFISDKDILTEFDIIVTLAESFEQKLYRQSFEVDYFCNFGVNKNVQNLIIYNAHRACATFQNLPIQLNMKTYESYQFINYLHLYQDVLNLIKIIYGDVFLNQPVTCFTINYEDCLLSGRAFI